jgi:hypothetical protein
MEYAMRALTIKQPWAWAIVAGHKRIENRSWAPPMALLDGERFAIHAGMGIDRAGVEWVRARGLALPEQFERGALIATARVARVVCESDDPWFMGPIGWVLEDVRAMTAVPARGALSLWRVPVEFERLLI